MGKFDTHGGYFAPDNYIRVNEGGSHDENPNGGVQMGVDPQGVPNMVEEDETVYDDYVFSDNITVDKEMQEKHLLPKWSVGKLYSAVVDRLVTEAEERGNDAISNKGLEAMLGRCRDAQEEQKALQEQRELEDELSQLSPEELDQLEAMLAQQGQAPQGEMMPQEQMIPEEQMMGPAEPMPREAMAMPGQEQVPMMANGGNLFRRGGKEERERRKMSDEVAAEILSNAQNTGRASGVNNTDLPLVNLHPELDVALMAAQPGSVMTKLFAPSAYRGIAGGLANGEGAQALIYGLSPETGEWVEISRRAADMQAGNSSKYALYKAVGEKEHLPSAIASRKANLVERGITPEGEPYVIRVNEFADPKELERRASYWRTERGYSGPDSWANSGSGSWKVRGHANGGFIRTFDGGGEKDIEERIKEARKQRGTGNDTDAYKEAGRDYQRALLGLGARRLTNWLDFAGANKQLEREKAALESMLERYASGEDVGGSYNQEKAIRHQSKYVEKLEKRKREREEKENALLKEKQDAQKRMNAFRFPFVDSFVPVDGYIDDDVVVDSPLVERRDTTGFISPADTAGLVFPKDVVGDVVEFNDEPTAVNVTPAPIAAGAWGSSDIVTPGSQSTSVNSDASDAAPVTEVVEVTPKTESSKKSTGKANSGYQLFFRDGGQMNRFDDGSWLRFLNGVRGYDRSRRAGNLSGKYAIDYNLINGSGYKTIYDLEQDPNYIAFTDYIVNHSDDPNVREYLHALDAGVADGVLGLFDGDELRDGWDKLYRERRNDQKGGIYHLSMRDISNLLANRAPALPALAPVGITDPTYEEINGARERLAPLAGINNAPDGIIGNPLVTRGYVDKEPGVPARRQDDNNRNPYLSTLPRYAGALTAGALGLYNAFQRPDRYTIPHYNPVLPQGQLHLTDPVYNPLDQEQAAQSVLASNAGTNRQIMNSGIGPSVGATLLASDYNAGQNLGAARQAVWDANNKRRNDVIGMSNQNALSLGQFDYGQSKDRASILNDAALRNAQNDFLRQRLNYMAEGEKYAALQSNLDAVSEALAGIGQENKVLNALNTNNALYHFLSPNGVAAYKAWEKDDEDATQNAKCGGKIKRKK